MTTFTITDHVERATTFEVSDVTVVNPEGTTPVEQLGVRIRVADVTLRDLGPTPERAPHEH